MKVLRPIYNMVSLMSQCLPKSIPCLQILPPNKCTEKSCQRRTVFELTIKTPNFHFCANRCMNKLFYTLFTIFTWCKKFLYLVMERTELFPGILVPPPPHGEMTNTKQSRQNLCCLAYDLTSNRGLMSLMPCSAATLMMWSRAFMRPNILTTSRTCSLEVRRSTSDALKLLRCKELAT